MIRLESVEVSRLTLFEIFAGVRPENLLEIVQNCKELGGTV